MGSAGTASLGSLASGRRWSPDVNRETQYRWVADEPLPEGWRQGASWIQDDGSMQVLYISAPPNGLPYDSEHKFVRLRRVTQERFVTEWVDVVPVEVA